jgi:hypothetical protein
MLRTVSRLPNETVLRLPSEVEVSRILYSHFVPCPSFVLCSKYRKFIAQGTAINIFKESQILRTKYFKITESLQKTFLICKFITTAFLKYLEFQHNAFLLVDE